MFLYNKKKALYANVGLLTLSGSLCLAIESEYIWSLKLFFVKNTDSTIYSLLIDNQFHKNYKIYLYWSYIETLDRLDIGNGFL